MLKRSLDFLLGSVLLLFLLPVIFFVAMAVRVALGSPAFFRQERPGLNGKPFSLLKFRTMTGERDVGGELLPDETRLTAFGGFLRRYSLDELPQLFNVVRGDMSLVGPRPLLMEYLPLYSAEQARRHEVRPGITGWAQVNGRNAITWEQRFALDVWYVNHQSLWLDIKILWLTFLRVLNPQGINQAGQATMSKFSGSESDPGNR